MCTFGRGWDCTQWCVVLRAGMPSHVRTCVDTLTCACTRSCVQVPVYAGATRGVGEPGRCVHVRAGTRATRVHVWGAANSDIQASTGACPDVRLSLRSCLLTCASHIVDRDCSGEPDILTFAHRFTIMKSPSVPRSFWPPEGPVCVVLSVLPLRYVRFCPDMWAASGHLEEVFVPHYVRFCHDIALPEMSLLPWFSGPRRPLCSSVHSCHHV